MLRALREGRSSRCIRDPIAIVVHGVNGRIIEQPLLDKDVECPGRLADDAERRRPVPENGGAEACSSASLLVGTSSRKASGVITWIRQWSQP